MPLCNVEGRGDDRECKRWKRIDKAVVENKGGCTFGGGVSNSWREPSTTRFISSIVSTCPTIMYFNFKSDFRPNLKIQTLNTKYYKSGPI